MCPFPVWCLGQDVKFDLSKACNWYKNGLTGLQSVNRFTGVQRLDYAPAFQCWSCYWALILFHLNGPWFICLLFWFIGELEVLHADRITHTTAVHRARVNAGLSLPPHTHKKFITDRSKAVLLLWFILIVNVRPLSVGLWLIVHFI